MTNAPIPESPVEMIGKLADTTGQMFGETEKLRRLSDDLKREAKRSKRVRLFMWITLLLNLTAFVVNTIEAIIR